MKPIATMACEIGNAGQFEFVEIVGLVQRILEIGVGANSFEPSVFAEARALPREGPASRAVESRLDFAVGDA
jgi:hypothetical protein